MNLISVRLGGIVNAFADGYFEMRLERREFVSLTCLSAFLMSATLLPLSLVQSSFCPFNVKPYIVIPLRLRLLRARALHLDSRFRR